MERSRISSEFMKPWELIPDPEKQKKQFQNKEI